jgi:hypothetical protein
MNHSRVKNLINLGYIIDETAVNLIEGLNENDFYKLVEAVKKENPFIINKELIDKLTSADVKIIKTFIPVYKFNVQEMVRDLNERYSKLQTILLRRVEFSDMITINKLSSGAASIIGLIKEKTERDSDLLVVLEDPTGEIQTTIPKNLGEKITLDDVVAVSGKMNNKILVADKLIYPDVPIRPVNYSSKPIRIALLEDGKECDSDYLLYKDRILDKIKNKNYIVTTPYLIDIGGVVILTLFDYTPIDILRKRYLNKENSDFIIEPIPDIILTNRDVNANYKGITIVSINNSINLKTREVNSI